MKDKRTEYLEELSARMVEWDVRIEQLKEQAEWATAEEKAEYYKAISTLQRKRDQGAEKLRGISMATDDEWDDLKTGAEQIWGEVKDLLRSSIRKT